MCYPPHINEIQQHLTFSYFREINILYFLSLETGSSAFVAAQYFPQESSLTLALLADSPFRTVPAVPSPVPLLEAVPRLAHWGSRKGWRLG